MNASILNGVSAIAAGNETEGLITNGTGQGESGAGFLASFAIQMQEQEQDSALEKVVGLLGEQDGQNVAALLGDSLPGIQKNMQIQDINLDETMAALQDILGGLSSADAQASVALQNLADTEVDANATSTPTSATELLAEQVDIPPIEGNILQEVTAVNDGGTIPEQTTDISSADSVNSMKGTSDDIDEELLIPVADFSTPPQLNRNVADIKVVTENAAAALPQMLRQEKASLAKLSTLETSPIEAEIDEGLDPKMGSRNIIRDNLLHTNSNLMDTVVDKISAKVTDLPTIATQTLGEQAGQKFSTADLSTLSRQVENATPKQELPAMTKAFNHPEWKQEFNERIVWMHNKAIPSAELRLNPQHLGPVSIQINVDKDQQASILFNAQNAGVREAIEAALPKLKDMLGAQQVTLAEANVSQQGQDQGNARQAMQDALQGRKQNNGNSSLVQETGALEVNDIAEEITQGRAVASKGLLSLYA
jgi:flagellar hook-length control protein FliK